MKLNACWKSFLWLTFYAFFLGMSLYDFGQACLDRAYWFAALYWVFAIFFSLYTLVHGYRLYVMYLWRHRHDA